MNKTAGNLSYIQHYLHQLYLATFIEDRDQRNEKQRKLMRAFKKRLAIKTK